MTTKKLDYNAIASSWLAGTLGDNKDLTSEQKRVVGLIACGSLTEEHMRAAGAEFVRGVKATRLFQRRHLVEGMLDRAQEGSFVVPWVMSDEVPDRAGDVIRVLGWDLESFKKNPVLLTNHDHNLDPIGRVLNPRVERYQGRLVLAGDVEFAVRESEDAARRFKLVQAGVLKTGSVGFLPKEVKDPTDQKERTELGLNSNYGVYFNKSELLEFSIVPLPMNPNALAMAVRDGRISSADADYAKAISGATERDWEKIIRARARAFVAFSNSAGAAAVAQEASEKTAVQVQSVLLPQSKFSKDQAAKWVEEHDLVMLGELEESDGHWKATIEDPAKAKTEPKVVQVDEDSGVKAMVCQMLGTPGANGNGGATRHGGGSVWVVTDAVATRACIEMVAKAMTDIAEALHRIADTNRSHAQAITDLGGIAGTSLRAERERVTAAMTSDAEKQETLETLTALDAFKETLLGRL